MIELPPEVEANLARIRQNVVDADIAWLLGVIDAILGRFILPTPDPDVLARPVQPGNSPLSVRRFYTSVSHPLHDRLRAKGVTTCLFCPHALKDHYRNCCGGPGCACPGLEANLKEVEG